VLVSQHLLWRSEAEDLHDGLAAPLTHDDALVLPEHDPPNGLARLGQLPNRRAGADLEQFDVAIVAACDEESVVELETRHGIVVRT